MATPRVPNARRPTERHSNIIVFRECSHVREKFIGHDFYQFLWGPSFGGVPCYTCELQVLVCEGLNALLRSVKKGFGEDREVQWIKLVEKGVVIRCPTQHHISGAMRAPCKPAHPSSNCLPE